MTEVDFKRKRLWGMSMSLDLYKCNPDTIRDADKIKEYVKQLCDLIEMKTYGKCHVVHFGDDPKVTGFSMTQLIETSLVSGHFANNTNAAYLDIFSCKWYDIDKVRDFSEKFFEAEASITKLNKRQ